jgi:dihydrofolate reductase
MKCTLHIAMSLDGYIADQQGSIAWLENAAKNPAIYQRIMPFITASEALVMGRITYEQVLGFGEWPYAGKQVVVVSNTLAQASSPNTVIVSPSDLLQALVATGAERVWIVGGGQLNAYMIDQGLLDEMIVTVVPLLLGAGTSLLSRLTRLTPMHLQATHELADGFLELTYTFARPC